MQANQSSSIQPQARKLDNNSTLAIQGIDIRTDAVDRYCLNHLHRVVWTLVTPIPFQSVRVGGEG